jgi:hypothetical protein
MATIYGRLAATDGRLTEIGRRVAPIYRDDVPLVQMPDFVGPYEYDSVNQLAIKATLTDLEKVETNTYSNRLILALCALNATVPMTPATINWAHNIVNQHAQEIDAIISGNPPPPFFAGG